MKKQDLTKTVVRHTNLERLTLAYREPCTNPYEDRHSARDFEVTSSEPNLGGELSPGT